MARGKILTPGHVPLQNEFFPRWNEVKAEHVKPAILTLIGELNEDITKLEGEVQPTWEGLVDPLERISDRIGRAWGTVQHLKARFCSNAADWQPFR
jgi:oligopeptidase A